MNNFTFENNLDYSIFNNISRNDILLSFVLFLHILRKAKRIHRFRNYCFFGRINCGIG